MLLLLLSILTSCVVGFVFVRQFGLMEALVHSWCGE
jgi:hypothetical protein